jgi:hypothetical protein
MADLSSMSDSLDDVGISERTRTAHASREGSYQVWSLNNPYQTILQPYEVIVLQQLSPGWFRVVG